MRTSSTFPIAIIFIVSIIAILFFSQCKKNSPPKPISKDSTYVILHDKPLSIIQSYINGNWELRYEEGTNFAGIFPQTDFFWRFGAVDSIKVIYHGNIVTDTTITWIREKDALADSTFTINFHDKLGYPYTYIVDGIYNDTLVLFDDASDYMIYHFTKTN